MIVCVFPVFSMMLCQLGINLLHCHISLCATNHVLSRTHTQTVSSLMHYVCHGKPEGSRHLLNCHALGTMVMFADKS